MCHFVNLTLRLSATVNTLASVPNPTTLFANAHTSPKKLNASLNSCSSMFAAGARDKVAVAADLKLQERLSK
jgi:hypothetical protein